MTTNPDAIIAGLRNLSTDPSLGRQEQADVLAAIAEVERLRRTRPGWREQWTAAIVNRSVTCAWCGNRYRTAVPADMDAGKQGSHCASDVVFEDGKWYIRGGYGSDEHDMERYVFVKNPPLAPADPVCDECISERRIAGDLEVLTPEVERAYRKDFALRPPGIQHLFHRLERVSMENAAMRPVVEAAAKPAPPSPSESDVTRYLVDLHHAVGEYQKFLRYTGELDDGGASWDENSPEVAELWRARARHFESIAAMLDRDRVPRP